MHTSARAPPISASGTSRSRRARRVIHGAPGTAQTGSPPPTVTPSRRSQSSSVTSSVAQVVASARTWARRPRGASCSHIASDPDRTGSRAATPMSRAISARTATSGVGRAPSRTCRAAGAPRRRRAVDGDQANGVLSASTIGFMTRQESRRSGPWARDGAAAASRRASSWRRRPSSCSGQGASWRTRSQSAAARGRVGTGCRMVMTRRLASSRRCW